MSKELEWVAIVCLNRKKNEIEKSLSKSKEGKTIPLMESNKPLFIRIRDYVISYYLSKQRYVHIELAFPTEGVYKTAECRSFSVFSDDQTGIREAMRKFTNKSYEWIFLSVTLAEKAKMLRFCESRHSFALGRNDRAYDETSLFMSQIWPIKRENRYWCVSFVISALQEIGMFRYHSANTFTVDEAVVYLRKHSRVFNGLAPRLLVEQQKNLEISENSSTPHHVSLFE
jgi:hypothetical protein